MSVQAYAADMPFSLPSGYGLRLAAPPDAPVIARQRGQMFTDMGRMSAAQVEASLPVWEGWLQEALHTGDYVGLLAECDGSVVGGAGLMFRSQIPSADDPCTQSGYILNIAVEAAHRRRGLAEALTRAALAQAAERGIRNVALMASPLGQRVYERLGFGPPLNPYLVLHLDNLESV